MLEDVSGGGFVVSREERKRLDRAPLSLRKPEVSEVGILVWDSFSSENSEREVNALDSALGSAAQNPLEQRLRLQKC